MRREDHAGRLAHLQPDGHTGGENIEGSSNEADDDGAPGVHGGGSRGDGHQPGQSAVAHDTHIIHMLACVWPHADLSTDAPTTRVFTLRFEFFSTGMTCMTKGQRMLRPSRPPLGGTCLSSLASYFLPLSSAFPAIQSGALERKEKSQTRHADGANSRQAGLSAQNNQCPGELGNTIANPRHAHKGSDAQ